MAPAVSVKLADVSFRLLHWTRLKTWVTASNRGARPLCGSHRSPPQAESLAAVGDLHSKNKNQLPTHRFNGEGNWFCILWH